MNKIKNFAYICLFLGSLFSVFYYFQVRKLYVFTGEWHWNLFEYYGTNDEKALLIVFGLFSVLIIMGIIDVIRKQNKNKNDN